MPYEQLTLRLTRSTSLDHPIPLRLSELTIPTLLYGLDLATLEVRHLKLLILGFTGIEGDVSASNAPTIPTFPIIEDGSLLASLPYHPNT